MSKERELLERLISRYYSRGELTPLKSIVNDAEKILSEPEPLKNEPADYSQGYKDGNDGKAFISLRDHFAGLAMQGFIAADNKFNLDTQDISDYAYAQANEMLKEREKGND